MAWQILGYSNFPLSPTPIPKRRLIFNTLTLLEVAQNFYSRASDVNESNEISFLKGLKILKYKTVDFSSTNQYFLILFFYIIETALLVCLENIEKMQGKQFFI